MELMHDTCLGQESSPSSQMLFPAAQRDALFAAILIHDGFYEHVELPPAIHLDYSQEQLIKCFMICRELWDVGVDRTALVKIIKKLRRQGSLGPEDQAQFKHMRARFKHLRFAFATFDQQHRYPRAFHWLIALMGCQQDAIRNHQHSLAARVATTLIVALNKMPYKLITRPAHKFRPSTTESFQNHINKGITFIHEAVSLPEVTALHFHKVRQLISQYVALYDNLKILYPSPYHERISQYLSTINGLMGNMHDHLVEKAFKKELEYRSGAIIIPDQIKDRLITLVSRFPQPGAG